MKKFQGVIAQLEQALCDFPYDKLDISDEVREQVELVHAQLRRAKERADMPDDEFYNDVLSLITRAMTQVLNWISLKDCQKSYT